MTSFAFRALASRDCYGEAINPRQVNKATCEGREVLSLVCRVALLVASTRVSAGKTFDISLKMHGE